MSVFNLRNEKKKHRDKNIKRAFTIIKILGKMIVIQFGCVKNNRYINGGLSMDAAVAPVQYSSVIAGGAVPLRASASF